VILSAAYNGIQLARCNGRGLAEQHGHRLRAACVADRPVERWRHADQRQHLQHALHHQGGGAALRVHQRLQPAVQLHRQYDPGQQVRDTDRPRRTQGLERHPRRRLCVQRQHVCQYRKLPPGGLSAYCRNPGGAGGDGRPVCAGLSDWKRGQGNHNGQSVHLRSGAEHGLGGRLLHRRGVRRPHLGI
jgi:hypothetical protein